jgi:hypothetical protein
MRLTELVTALMVDAKQNRVEMSELQMKLGLRASQARATEHI